VAREFSIPTFYRSPIVSTLKKSRAKSDPRKKDLSPTVIEHPGVRFKLARHFGFCYGVENAIETAFRALEENPGKRIFLLSEMIHNPAVNRDLEERGVRFLMTTDGTPIVPLSEITNDDIVIIPAFGTTVSMLKKLEGIIIHGKHYHEETKATFSRAVLAGPSIIVRDRAEAERLAHYIKGGDGDFYEEFKGKYSEGFDPRRDLKKIGVVNQTTMLANETIEIAEFFREVISSCGDGFHFADTRDTLCYATEENQSAVLEMVKQGGDLAIIVGGYNSSNTTHLAKICAEYLPTYHIKDDSEIITRDEIRHLKGSDVQISKSWLPSKPVVDVLISAGASSPDSLVDSVIKRVAEIVR
jgi:4-hydroxy-3-methylbut-2-enyl diphosphate reductase